MKGSIYLLAAFLLFGCAESQEAKNKLTVFVSIPPQAGMVKNIAIGHDALEVISLVSEGQSPHTYEPTAKQLAKLDQADVLFTIGLPFEQALLKKIKPLYPNLHIIETQQGIERRTMPHTHHGEPCTHDHGQKDPHIWLSHSNASILAGNMQMALSELDPDHSELYTKNFGRLARQLAEDHAYFVDQLKPYKGSRFYVFHPSFGYFADAYGLKQIPVELEGKAPSPRQLVALINQAKADGVKVVFVQKQFPVNSAKAIADAINGTVVQLDPLAEDGVANLHQIGESIAQALEK